MTDRKKIKLIAVVGPTASGKSDLAIKLARKIGGEIISADSRQVYRGMDLGTGKVPKSIPKSKIKNQKSKLQFKNQKLEYYSGGIRHHLIDVASPRRQFTVADFKRLGEQAINDIVKRNKVPIICGGTGFYIDALLDRVNLPEVPPNPKLRAKLEKLTAEQLFERLKKIDPRRAGAIDSNNSRRLIRALEIVLATGQPVPKLRQSDKYQTLWIGIKFSREELEKRIKKRLEQRLKQGMVNEVRRLINQGVTYKRMEDLGLEYRWISRYLNGKISKEKMKEALFRAILQYSKRQMTWFRRNKEICWVRNYREALARIRSLS